MQYFQAWKWPLWASPYWPLSTPSINWPYRAAINKIFFFMEGAKKSESTCPNFQNSFIFLGRGYFLTLPPPSRCSPINGARWSSFDPKPTLWLTSLWFYRLGWLKSSRDPSIICLSIYLFYICTWSYIYIIHVQFIF